MTLSKVVKSALSVAVVGILGLGMIPTPANASTATATFIVSTSIQATCLISTTPLSFGTYTGLTLTSTSTVTVTCTNGTAYDVGLNAGTATGATTTTRSMTGPGGALLSYELDSDSARTINWGNIVDTDTVEMTGTGLSQTMTVYGQVHAGQYFAPGIYSDTVTATVTY
jgi:spore coat protein U-like protein